MTEHPRQTLVAMSKPMAYRGDGDLADKRYIPARTLGGIRRQEGAQFVLPDLADVREYASQLDQIRAELMVRGASEPELIFIPETDEILDITIQQHLTLLQAGLNKNTSYVLSPYSHTNENEEWMALLRRNGITISADIALKSQDLTSLDNRGGWGRHIDDPTHIPVPELAHIPYPVSWIAKSGQEALDAYTRVARETGDSRVQMKGVFSAGGFVNVTVESLAEAEHHYRTFTEKGALGETGAVEMQGFIPDLDPEHGIYSLQYSTHHGIHRIDTPGGLCTQIMDKKDEWIGNRFNDPKLIRTHGQAAHTLFGELGKVLNGSLAKGGIDIASTRTTASGLVVIEHNAKRMTGAHPAIELMNALDVPKDMPAVTKKCEMNINCDLATLWDVLKNEGAAFDINTKTGLFPICWMNGHYGMLMAFGDVESTDVLEQQIDNVYNILAQRGYLS